MQKRFQLGKWMRLAALTLFLVAGMFCLDANTIVSHAEATGTVKTKSATIRREPDTNSEVLASILANDKVDIAAQTTGADGYTWYKVYVNGNTMGYIRSDLINKTGDVPTESAPASSAPAETGEQDAAEETGSADTTSLPAMAEGVSASQVATAKVTASTVRVRQEASTSAGVAGNAANGTVVNVIGEITDANANVWYQVSFSQGNKQVNGFIRSDFLEAQDMVPEPEPEEPPAEAEPEPEPEVQKEYETIYEPDSEGLETWYLYHYGEDGTTRVKINELMGAQETINNLSTHYQSQQKNFKIALIGLIVLAGVLVIALIIMAVKLRETSYEYEDDDEDDEYEDEDEYDDDSYDDDEYEDDEYEDEEAYDEDEDAYEEEEEVRSRKKKGRRFGFRKKYEEEYEDDEEDYDEDEDDEDFDDEEEEEVYERRPRREAEPKSKKEPARSAGGEIPHRSMTPGGKATISTKPKKPLRSDDDFPYDREVTYQGEGRRVVSKEDKNWQSKNFLDMDDEFEFEFLDLK